MKVDTLPRRIGDYCPWYKAPRERGYYTDDTEYDGSIECYVNAVYKATNMTKGYIEVAAKNPDCQLPIEFVAHANTGKEVCQVLYQQLNYRTCPWDCHPEEVNEFFDTNGCNVTLESQWDWSKHVAAVENRILNRSGGFHVHIEYVWHIIIDPVGRRDLCARLVYKNRLEPTRISVDDLADLLNLQPEYKHIDFILDGKWYRC